MSEKDRPCRYPCGCDQFPGDHCACMEGHRAPRVGAPIERAGEALRTSRLMWGTHADRWNDQEWQRGFWTEAAEVALGALLPSSGGRGDVCEWHYAPEQRQDHGGADVLHYIVCGDRLVAEAETEADARLIVEAVTADGDRRTYGEAEAWKDNYDGMFQRWAECDAERLALKEEVRTLTLRLRIAEQDAAIAEGHVEPTA